MADSGESSPLPIPKGSYQIDFDNLDDFNPFQTKKELGLGSSPPITGTGNSNNNKVSPIDNEDINIDDIDPFKSGNALSNSPPTNLVNNNEGEVESKKKVSPKTKKVTPKKSPSKKDKSPAVSPKVQANEASSPPKNSELVEPDSPKELDDTLEATQPCQDKTPEKDSGIETNDVKSSPESTVTPKKTPTPKKSLKKPRSGTKSKSPKQFVDVDDEIQIFAPKRQLEPETNNVVDKPNGDNSIEIYAPPPPSVKDTSITELEATTSEEPSFLVTSPVTDLDLSSADVKTKTPSNEKSAIAKALTEDLSTSGDDEITFHDAQQEISDAPPEMSDAPPMSASADLQGSKEMTGSLDAFHEFGNGENEMAEDNEGFVPATDIFADNADWDMLEKLGSKNTLTLGRESLYVAFDPFVNPIKPAAEAIQEKEEETTPPRPSASISISSETDLLQLNTPSPSKLKQKNKSHPASRKLQDQFENKKARDEDVDRLLLSTSPIVTKDKEDNMATNDQVVQLVQVMKYSQTDWNKLKQELELTFQAEILNKEKEWSKKLADTQKKLGNQEEKTRKANQTTEDMRAVVAEFEKTISQLQAERQKTCLNSKQSLQDVMKERDQALEDLNSVETAFSDLHRRFEKAKGAVENFKQNEEILKKCVEEHQSKVKRAESKLQALKHQAEEKLEQAHNDLEKIKKSTSTEIAKLEAAFKKSEIQIKGLEHSLEQKKKENEELTAICDELISKVG